MSHELHVIQRVYLKGGMSKFKAVVLKWKKKKKEEGEESNII